MNELRSKLQEKEFVIGTLVSVASQPLAEALSRTDLDWLFIDMEHSTLSYDDVQSMIQSLGERCLSFIRLQDSSTRSVKLALDTGCTGIIVPRVDTKDKAMEIVNAAMYPPIGERSIGVCRSNQFGKTLSESIVGDNSRISVHVQIEHVDALDELDDIAQVNGIDGLFVGPYDLSGSFGKPGAIHEEDVVAAIKQVERAAAKNNKVPGIFCGNEKVAQTAIENGFQFVVVGADLLRLMKSCDKSVDTLRNGR
ncbi:MAG: HpcH/HpaI aldolase family protein [Hyphomicrobiaceae bacterium]